MVATTGMRSWASRRCMIDGSTAVHVADEAELARPGHGRDEAGVLAGQADGQGAVDVDGGDDVAVDLADQHHAGDVEGLGVGDPQPVEELGHLAQPGHERADLGPAAVDDHRQHADRAHEDDVLGELGQRRRVGARRRRQRRCRRT